MSNMREALEQALGEEVKIRTVSWEVIDDGLGKLAGTPLIGQILRESKRLQQAVFRTASGAPVNEPTRCSRCLFDVMLDTLPSSASFAVDARMNIIRITASVGDPQHEDRWTTAITQLVENRGVAISVSTRKLVYDMMLDYAPRMPKWLPTWRTVHPGRFVAIKERNTDAFPPALLSAERDGFSYSIFVTRKSASTVLQYITTEVGKKRAAAIKNAIDKYDVVSFQSV